MASCLPGEGHLYEWDKRNSKKKFNENFPNERENNNSLRGVFAWEIFKKKASRSFDYSTATSWAAPSRPPGLSVRKTFDFQPPLARIEIASSALYLVDVNIALGRVVFDRFAWESKSRAHRRCRRRPSRRIRSRSSRKRRTRRTPSAWAPTWWCGCPTRCSTWAAAGRSAWPRPSRRRRSAPTAASWAAPAACHGLHRCWHAGRPFPSDSTLLWTLIAAVIACERVRWLVIQMVG